MRRGKNANVRALSMPTRATPFLVVAFLLALCASNALAIEVTIQDGAQHAVCTAAAGIAAKISRSQFQGTNWRRAYASARWLDDSYPAVTAEGREARVSYSHVKLDLDNDGHEEVVIRYTGMIRSVDFDHVYVAPLHRFEAAAKTDSVAKLL